jgi:hypothetical protein
MRIEHTPWRLYRKSAAVCGVFCIQDFRILADVPKVATYGIMTA